MPAPEISHLYQRAVLWPRTGTDRYGQPVVGSPVEIAVQWNTARREVLDPQGNTIALDATARVTQDVAIGSHLWLGTLAQWYGSAGSGSTVNDTELMEVKTLNRTPDARNRYQTRTVGLMRLHNPPQGG